MSWFHRSHVSDDTNISIREPDKLDKTLQFLQAVLLVTSLSFATEHPLTFSINMFLIVVESAEKPVF